MAYTISMKSKVTSKGQVTIPIEIRRKLQIEPGQELDFDPEAPFLKATKVVNEAQMRSVLGCLKRKGLPDTGRLIEEMRGKVDLP
jgi:AbrB family looped-hinge helix DNA binding protein